MSAYRTFISFDFDHNEAEKHLFAGQAKHSQTPFEISDWSSKSSLSSNQWEHLIEEKINKCNILIVLIGKYTANATGVLKEITFAKRNNVPVFGVYVGGANIFTTLPTGLERNKTISWEWNLISFMINKAMREGKNTL